ncbi:AMP-binding protein [Bacillus licheniformis]|nr:AMP-binding protein [Bacillus licheniformis]
MHADTGRACRPGGVAFFHKHTILIDDPAVSAESGRNLEIAAEPDDLAYIMYTSGTTGNRKAI